MQALAVLLPGQVLALAGPHRGAGLRIVPVDLQVAQLRVRHQLAVVDDRRADTGAQGDHHEEAGAVTALSVDRLGQARRVGVVDGVDGPSQGLGDGPGQVRADPGLIHVGRGPGVPVLDDRGEADADRGVRLGGELPGLQLGDDRLHDGDDGLRGGRLRGVDAVALGDQVPGAQVHDPALDAGAADVHADGQLVGGGGGQGLLPVQVGLHGQLRAVHVRLLGHGCSFCCVGSVGSGSGPCGGTGRGRWAQGRVRTSTPSAVTTMVCSNCAERLRSFVTTVQSSSHMSQEIVPRLSMGSMVKTMPSWITVS